MQIRSVGIDLGKTTFHPVALGDNGKVLLKKKFTQRQLITFTANLQTTLIGLEACAGAHFLGRALREQGHDVKLIPAQFVRPFVKSNKNDFIDAEAIAEAVDRQNMRFVPIKTDDQLDLQALHRVRDRLMSRRTSVINQLRAFLLERGITFRQGRTYLRKQIPVLLEDAEQRLSPRMRRLVDRLWQEWKALEEQIEALSGEIDSIARMRRASDYWMFPVSGPLSKPLWLPQSETDLRLPRGVISLRGWGWYQDNTLLVVKRGCWGSVNAATHTSGDCSS